MPILFVYGMSPCEEDILASLFRRNNPSDRIAFASALRHSPTTTDNYSSIGDAPDDKPKCYTRIHYRKQGDSIKIIENAGKKIKGRPKAKILVGYRVACQGSCHRTNILEVYDRPRAI